MRLYEYVGPPEILAAATSSSRRLIKSAQDVACWVHDTGQLASANGEVTATFIVSASGDLWIADRRSEHVACASSLQVLAAGEMTFRIKGERAEVVAASNQSTGFCPQPESWGDVERALDAATISHPGGFTSQFDFRRCDSCGVTNIVKDSFFWCDACDSPLSAGWNFG